jgi:hypothetical protein
MLHTSHGSATRWLANRMYDLRYITSTKRKAENTSTITPKVARLPGANSRTHPCSTTRRFRLPIFPVPSTGLKPATSLASLFVEVMYRRSYIPLASKRWQKTSAQHHLDLWRMAHTAIGLHGQLTKYKPSPCFWIEVGCTMLLLYSFYANHSDKNLQGHLLRSYFLACLKSAQVSRDAIL